MLNKLLGILKKYTKSFELCEICGKQPHTGVVIASEGGFRYCDSCTNLSNLIFAATAKCPCGAGLAYKADMDYWDCSEILLNTADKKKTHTAKLPFVFWEIKSELQPSAFGCTTRKCL